MSQTKSALVILVFCILLSLVPSAVHAQGDEPAEVDFEKELQDWVLENGWTITEENGNQVLQGTSTGWAIWEKGQPEEYHLSLRIRVMEGGLHLITNLNETGRYFIGIYLNGIQLSKQLWPDSFENGLAGGEAPIPGEEWVQVDLFNQTDQFRMYVDGVETWSFQDPERLDPGAIAFETFEDSLIQIDDIRIDFDFNEPTVVAQPAEADVETPAPQEEETEETETEEKEAEGEPEPALVEAEPVVLLDNPPQWVRTGGPLGGLGYDVRMHPDNPDLMYVTDAYAGVFISQDGGMTWYPSNNGISDRSGESQDAIPVFCLTINPHNPDIIWAGTQFSGGLFKSTDGGQNWVRKTNGVTIRDGLTFRGITIDPVEPDTVYAAGEIASYVWAGGEGRHGREFDMTQGIVYKSTDGGENWVEIWRGMNMARYIWINPQDNNIIYVSTGIFDREAANSNPVRGEAGGVGVIKSTDGGQTWVEVNQGLNNLYVGSLFMHPENPEILLAGTGNNQYFYNNGIYITTDGAQNWKKVSSGFININSVEFSISDPSIAYAGADVGILRSEDGGQTWTMLQEEGAGWGSPGVKAGFPIDFQVDPRDPDRIFANNYGGGNYLSEDGGNTWADASTGYTGAQTRSLSIEPGHPGLVYVAARSGIFRSFDGGMNWEGLVNQDWYINGWQTIAVKPDQPEVILASSTWWNQLIISYSRGETWEPAIDLWASLGFRDIEFSHSNPKIVYAGTAGFISAGGFDPGTPGDGIYRSLDGGSSWEKVTNEAYKDAHITELAISDTDPNIVFAGTENYGLIRSLDGGESWTSVKQGLGFGNRIRSVVVHPHDPEIVFAGLPSGGIYRSNDTGASWQHSSIGLSPEANITAIVIDPNNPDLIYAADSFSGVYRSQDGGASWQAFSEGLLMRAVYTMALSDNSAHLYAATDGSGVFRRDLAGDPPASAPGWTPPEEITPPPEDEEAEEPQEDQAEIKEEPVPAVEPTTEEENRGSQFCPTSYLPLIASIAFYQSWKIGSKKED